LRIKSFVHFVAFVVKTWLYEKEPMMAAVVRSAIVAIAATGSLVLSLPSAYAQQPGGPGAVVGAAPQSLAELAPAPIPEDENAAVQIKALAALLDNWANDHGRFSMTPLGLAYDEREDRGEPPTDKEAAAIQELMEQYAELDAGLSRTAACKEYASRADFSVPSTQFIDEMLPRIQQFRSVGRFYAWRIRMLSYHGDHDEAVRRGIEVLRLTRLHESEPTLVAYLVTLAVRHTAIRELYDALAAGRVSFEMHAALDAELSLLDDPQAFHRMLLTERAFAMSAEQAGPLGIANFLGAGMGTGASDYLEAVIAASREPWPEFRKELRDGGKFAVPTGFGVMADNLAPGVIASAQAHGRNIALVRSLRAFNALRLFAETKKREATGLEELDLPAEAIRDPFADRPLRADLTDAGWLIYSVMTNEQDDGGDFREQRDYGVTPPGERRAQ
jgi:hypothetical protein